MHSVLVSGAGVAGLTLAYWLRRNGHEVTVVERAPAVRPGGQAIDVRGTALEVLDRMGLRERAALARTGLRGMAMLDGQGNELWRSTEMTISGGRLDSEDIELLREDLTSLLHERARQAGAEFLFGDSLCSLADGPDGVLAGFESGAERTFGLVLGADGLHSRTRALAFGPEREFLHHMGSYLAVFSAENFLGLDNWEIWLTEGREATYCVYPVRDNSQLRITLGFRSEPVAYDHRDTERQRTLLTERLSHVGWETPRLLQAMRRAPDFYFDSLAQIRMDRWSTGRVALVGDAGYCPSPLSGQGTSLALVGAFILADELRADGDHVSAFARYETRMRRYVELNQALALANQEGSPDEKALEQAKYAVTLDR
ncbi:FAD-dependent monooxygenase [Streptomyces orinoci]|uniref:FAD-dependent monooxygenase n=1 Tax=Streptomyces orinoci TaxID=67339 RepID=A0ABV3K540_STRON|nr:FAD-dependent monooxygenase [Streptomyces orinoci]